MISQMEIIYDSFICNFYIVGPGLVRLNPLFIPSFDEMEWNENKDSHSVKKIEFPSMQMGIVDDQWLLTASGKDLDNIQPANSHFFFQVSIFIIK